MPTRRHRAWFSLRGRFEKTWQAVTLGREVDPDEIISTRAELPELSELRVELSQPTFASNQAGRLLINKVPDGARSPDRADAVCIAFGAPMSTAEVWSRL